MSVRITALCIILMLLVGGWAHAAAGQWQLKDMSGHIHTPSTHLGKWLIVNYWAPWCPPCLDEMPELVAFYDAHPSQVMTLGIAVQYTSEQSVKTYVNDMLISYPVILGDQQKSQLLPTEVLPTTYIYKPDGSLFQIKRGPVSRLWLEQHLGLSRSETKTP